MRIDGRRPDQLRPIELIRAFTKMPAGSVFVRAGLTHVLCTAAIVPEVPEWRAGSGKGWLTAEYDMLPASTHTRRPRNRREIDGRTQEIQRLIGRSLRAVVDTSRMGERTIHLDCDVLQADGGTRTAAITGAYVALCDAISHGRREGWWGDDVLRAGVAAVSVGLVGGQVLLDLCYSEDSQAAVDCNLVMTTEDQWVEVQATGEKTTLSDRELSEMLDVGRRGIHRLFEIQREALR